MRAFSASALVLAFTSIASAHPGHGAVPSDGATTWLHHVAEPMHLGGAIGLVAVLVAVAMVIARTQSRRRSASTV